VNFVAIDVETANPDFGSICQVGVAAFRDGTLHDTWESLVDPEDHFDEMNVAVHGIDESAVRGAPKWQTVYELLAPWFQGHVVASHTPFDRAALSREWETGDRLQFVRGAEYYWRATLTDLIEATLRPGNRGLSPITLPYYSLFLKWFFFARRR
jgi:hypothetical protein